MDSLLDKKYFGSQSGTNYVYKLEKLFNEYMSGNDFNSGREFRSITFCNATNAIYATLLGLNLRPGDSILTTPFTWGGTIAGALQLGLKIVFTDIHPVTLTLHPESVADAMKTYPEIKAVIDVDIYGNPSLSYDISKILSGYNACHIIDSASAFGARLKSKPTGYFGDVVIHSFGESKQVSVGEGAILATHDQLLFENILIRSQHPNRVNRDVSVYAQNPFALNLRIHPYAAYLLYEGFSKSLKRIRSKQDSTFKLLKEITDVSGLPISGDMGDDYLPSFNNIVINLSRFKDLTSIKEILNKKKRIHLVQPPIRQLVTKIPALMRYYRNCDMKTLSDNVALDAIKSVIEIHT